MTDKHSSRSGDDHVEADTPNADVLAGSPSAEGRAILQLAPVPQVPTSSAPDTASDCANTTVSISEALRDRLAVIRELYRQRQDLLNAEGTLARQINRIVARKLGKPEVSTEEVKVHAPSVLVDMRTVPLAAKRALERQITKEVEQLPVWQKWGEGVRGFGPMSLGAIIGEVGNLSDFSTVAKLWKFMGMGLVDGERQRKCKEKDKAIAHAYCPRRRALMFVMGENLIRAGGDYKALYDARKVYEQQTVEAAGIERSKMHIHLRAKRYIEKRLLRELWRAWRDQGAAANLRLPVESLPSEPVR